MKRMILLGLPLTAFLLLALFLWRGLSLDPRKLPSALLNKPVPIFSLPTLQQGDKRFSDRDFQGKVAIVNVWASWCLSCRDEHALLMSLARAHDVQIYGLNYKDTQADAQQWLERYGDPYDLIGMDAAGDIAIDWGVYGTPETFLVDKNGIIRYKHVGVLTSKVWEEAFQPLIQQLKA